MSPLRRFPLFVRCGAAGLGVLGGCVTYQTQPLESGAVDRALEPPKTETVVLAAGRIKHPLLRPLTIDEREGFSPDEIAVMTVVASPALRALRAQHGVARAQLVEAGLLPNPQFGASFDRVQAHGDPTLVNGSSLGVSWDVTALLALREATAAARATADALDLSIAWQEWQAAQDARLRAFRILSLEERLPWAREVESDLTRTMSELQQAVAQRLRVATDLAPAGEAQRRAEADRFALEEQLIGDRAALNLALGRPADAPLALRAAAAFPALPTQAGAELLRGLEARRLDLVALKLGYASQEAALRGAVKAQFPKINVSFARARDTSNVATRSIGITLELPLFDRGQGRIAIAQATRQQLFDEYVARVAEARSQVGQMIKEIAATRQQLVAVEATLPRLESLAAALGAAVTERRVGTGDYRDARGALAARRIERSQLQQSLVELGVGLEIATGRPLLNRSAAGESP